MNTIFIAAAAIINDNNQMLLVRKKNTNAFMQPGGKIDNGETPSGALVRELHEELALNVAESDLAYVGRFSAPAANETGHVVDAEVYRISHNSKLKCQAEIAEMIWYPNEKYVAVELAPLTRDFILPASGV